MKLITQLTASSGRAGKYLQSRLSAFAADRSGFSAMTFAISAIPMFGLVGLAVDVGTAFHMKAQVQQAVDTVATQLARRSMLDANLTNEQLVDRGKQMMSNNLDFAVSYEKFDVKITEKQVEITAQAQYDTNFSKIVGVSSLDITATAMAKFEVEQTDIFILIDNSASMLIGATQAEVDRMRSETGCEFACHVEATAADGDRYQIALQRGYKLRYHAVRDAIGALTDRLKQMDPSGQAYRVGLYHFGFYDSYPTKLAKSMNLSSNLDAVKTNASKLMPMRGNGRMSDFVGFLTQMRAEMKSKKVGSRPQILLFISDGMHDSDIKTNFGYFDGVWTGPVNRSSCTNIKNDGVTVATLYTPYNLSGAESDTWYTTLKPLLPREMQNCASPGLYAEVDFEDANSYAAQMEMLISKAGKKNLRLVRD